MKAKSLLLFAAALLTAFAGGAWSQQYPAGIHTFTNKSGTLRVVSGYVNHINAHTFHVYTFQFKPTSEKRWHQLLRLEGLADTQLLFHFSTRGTPEAMLSDARVINAQGEFTLVTAQRQWTETRYDANPLLVKRYKLTMTNEDERWVFLLDKIQTLDAKSSVERALSAAR